MTDAKTETAFVLPADAVLGQEGPVHFGGFPGIWYPEQPIAVGELGFETVKDAREAKKLLAPDLAEKSVKAGSAPMPEQDNHVPLAASAEESEQVVDEALAPAEPVATEGAEQ